MADSSRLPWWFKVVVFSNLWCLTLSAISEQIIIDHPKLPVYCRPSVLSDQTANPFSNTKILIVSQPLLLESNFQKGRNWNIELRRHGAPNATKTVHMQDFIGWKAHKSSRAKAVVQPNHSASSFRSRTVRSCNELPELPRCHGCRSTSWKVGLVWSRRARRPVILAHHPMLLHHYCSPKGDCKSTNYNRPPRYIDNFGHWGEPPRPGHQTNWWSEESRFWPSNRIQQSHHLTVALLFGLFVRRHALVVLSIWAPALNI